MVLANGTQADTRCKRRFVIVYGSLWRFWAQHWRRPIGSPIFSPLLLLFGNCCPSSMPIRNVWLHIYSARIVPVVDARHWTCVFWAFYAENLAAKIARLCSTYYLHTVIFNTICSSREVKKIAINLPLALLASVARVQQDAGESILFTNETINLFIIKIGKTHQNGILMISPIFASDAVHTIRSHRIEFK